MGERPQLDPERQRQAKSYAGVRRRLALAEGSLGLIYLAAWAVSGAASTVVGLVEENLRAGWPVDLLAVAAAMAVPWFVITFPIGYYGSYVLPHRFGQSTQTLRLWIADRLKGAALGLVLGVPLLVAVYLAMRLWPGVWWLAAGAGYLGFLAVMSIVAPTVLLPLFFKFRPLGGEHQELAERLTRISAEAGRRVRGVFTFDMSRRTRSANAALVGLGNTRRILLGDTLLGEFTDDEVEAVYAHELGHHVHRDIPRLMLMQAGLTLLSLWAGASVLEAAVRRGVLQAVADPAGLPLLILTASALAPLLVPLANAFSRRREGLADRFAVGLTRKPTAFADAMTRLANQNLADANPPRWAVLAFATHPPLNERIRRAEQTVLSR